jgi:hypothetical protein
MNTVKIKTEKKEENVELSQAYWVILTQANIKRAVCDVCDNRISAKLFFLQ